VHGGVIWLKQEDAYHLAASYGYSKEYADLMGQRVISPGRDTIIGRTALEQGIVHVPDVLDDPEYRWAEAQRLGGFRTILGVPLLLEGVSIGAMTVAPNRVAPFSPSQIELAKTFADQAVIAIKNVRLFDEAQARIIEAADGAVD
jgi:GAF domain-containing protein